MIIGITGTNGAGKGAAVEYLKSKGFVHFSASEFIKEKVVRRGMPLSRTSMRVVGNDLRKTHYPAYIVETLYEKAVASAAKDAIIESVREIAGAKFLKEHGAYLMSVDADRRIRYERAILRGSAKDKVTYEEFCEQEDQELTKAASHDMNILTVMKMADFHIENNGTLEELHQQIENLYTAHL